MFFFYREAEGLSTYPILDKWLCMAWCAVDGTLNENTRVYDTYFRSPKSKELVSCCDESPRKPMASM
jgi:hypothetical protein